MKQVHPRAQHRLDRRAFTGAWVETSPSSARAAAARVAPSRARGLKHRGAVRGPGRGGVAPSRARGLKPGQQPGGFVELVGRAFTGAWVETPTLVRQVVPHSSRAFTGAWVETHPCTRRGHPSARRAFTGAWVETTWPQPCPTSWAVAPSRARGLKLMQHNLLDRAIESRLHGRVG